MRPTSFSICHGAAAALQNSADFSPFWALLARNCWMCSCSHACVFPAILTRFLFGQAAPDFCVSSIVLHRNSVLCSEAALAQANLSAHENAFARLLAASSSSPLAGSYLADRCDLFLGAVNGVARLHCHQLRITATISTAAML